MSITQEMIDAMIDAGLTREQMAALMKASIAQEEARRAEERAKAAARQRKSRANREQSRNVTVTPRDTRDECDSELVPPSPDGPSSFPQTPNQNPLNPPSTSPTQEGASADVLPFPTTKPRKADRGTRLPADWQPSAELIEFARKEGMTDAKIERELASFRDYWLAASGPNAVKRDWTAAGRNWLRKAAGGFGGPRGSAPIGHGSPSGGRFGAMQRALARVAHSDALPE